MANHVLISSKVRDFKNWKTEYDAHKPKRDAAGLTETAMFHSASDPNEIFLLFKAADMNRAKQFIESADLRDAMQKSGVIGRPDVHFLTD